MPMRPDPRRCVNSFRNTDSSFDELRNVLVKLVRLNSQYENYRKQVSQMVNTQRIIERGHANVSKVGTFLRGCK